MQKVSWKNCLKATEKKFKYAVGHIYVSEVQPAEDSQQAVARVKDMIGKIRSSLEQLIQDTPWMDADTKRRAIEKSSLIEPMVGYSDTVMDLVM